MEIKRSCLTLMVTLIVISSTIAIITISESMSIVQGANFETPVGSDWTMSDLVSAAPSTIAESSGEYTVSGNITINYGATLTIETGAVLKFDQHKMLLVKGTLLAIGTESEVIKFTSNLNPPAEKDWIGIIFESRSDKDNTSRLEHTVVEFAFNGIDCRSASPAILHSTITNCHNGIYGNEKSSPLIRNNAIVDNNFWGIRLNNADTEISNSTITNNYLGIYSQHSELVIADNYIENNTQNGLILKDENTLLVRNRISSNGKLKSKLYAGLKVENSELHLISNEFKSNSHAGMELSNSTVFEWYDEFVGNLVGLNMTDRSRLYATQIEIRTSKEHGIKSVGSELVLTDPIITDNGWGEGGTGPYFTGIYLNSGKGTIINGIISHSGHMGIAIEDAEAYIDNSRITRSNLDGIYSWFSSPIIRNSTIEESVRYDLLADSGAHPILINSTYIDAKLKVLDETGSIKVGFSISLQITNMNGAEVESAVAILLEKSVTDGSEIILSTSQPSNVMGVIEAIDIFDKMIYHNRTTFWYLWSNESAQPGAGWTMHYRVSRDDYSDYQVRLMHNFSQDLRVQLNKVPEITLTTPSSIYSGNVKGTLDFEGSAIDEDGIIAYVYYRVDNNAWQAIEVTLDSTVKTGAFFNWAFQWDTRTVTSGEHELQFKSFDGTGYSPSIQLTIEVDNPGGFLDDDNDGMTFAEELLVGTDPDNPDTDDDGLTDGLELDSSDGNTTDPLKNDSDGDGISDGVEDKNQNGLVEPTETDPNNADSDSDGVDDDNDDFPLDNTRVHAEESDAGFNYKILAGIMAIILGVLIAVVIRILVKTKYLNERK